MEPRTLRVCPAVYLVQTPGKVALPVTNHSSSTDSCALPRRKVFKLTTEKGIKLLLTDRYKAKAHGFACLILSVLFKEPPVFDQSEGASRASSSGPQDLRDSVESLSARKLAIPHPSAELVEAGLGRLQSARL